VLLPGEARGNKTHVKSVFCLSRINADHHNGDSFVPTTKSLALLSALSVAALASPAMAQPGQLDPSFGNNGIAVLPISTVLTLKSLQQPNGDILVDAAVSANATDIVRLLPNGAVDTTFGNQGIVSLSIPNNVFSGQGDMQLQPDGSIVVLGVVNVPVRRGPIKHGVVARFLANGAPDTSFGANGIVQLTQLGGSQSDTPRALLLQPNGQILIADFSSNPSVTRLNSNGSVDTSFGDDGIASVPGGTDGAPQALALQSDGKILVIEYKSNMAFETRLLPNGTIDSSTTPGTVIASSAAQAQISASLPLAVQSNDDYITVQTTGPQLQQFDLQRFALTNAQDNSFKNPVIAFGSGVTNLSQDYANIVQPNGSILAVGRFFKSPNEDFGMARVLSTGALDTGFGTKGVVVTPFPGNNALATAVALQGDGNIVVAGTSDGELAVARYLGQ
jgi:uncharacterized delta-60 repeat protein